MYKALVDEWMHFDNAGVRSLLGNVSVTPYALTLEDRKQRLEERIVVVITAALMRARLRAEDIARARARSACRWSSGGSCG